MARKKLLHWGFNFKRKQILLSRAMDPLLVDALQKSEVYPSLDYRDRMHGLVIFLHRMLFQTFDLIITSKPHRRTLDERLSYVGARGFFVDGHVVKPQKTIFSDVGMTATDKCWLIFLLSHVFGWDPDDVIFGNRTLFYAMTTAIAQAQLMLLAVKGRRLYSKQELQVIFDQGFVTFFSALESVKEMHYNALLREANATGEPEPKRFRRQQRLDSGTDTEDTDDERVVGGLGSFSHSTHCLTHQHWVDQCISAGCFNVHCTQAAEAAHKLNMYRASVRVRHLDSNRTQEAMLRYLCWDAVFKHLTRQVPDMSKDPRRQRPTPGVHNTISTTLNHDSRLDSVAFQRAILHREVRLAGVEFLDLLCVQLGLPTTRHSYTRLNSLRFRFGQKLVRRGDERIFWATDSQYTIGSGTRRHRRDFLRLQGDHQGNALCCEALCFVEVSNARVVGSPVDKRTFVIVRWLQPDPRAWGRDELCRPLCPGPLSLNNCLWTYATTTRPRGSEVEPLHAYFGFVTPDNIIGTVHMCHGFVRGSSQPDHNTWLETVHMC